MEASSTGGAPCNSLDPLSEQIKQTLFKKGIFPTPKIIHTLRKKHLQKSKRIASKTLPKPINQSQEQAFSHEFYFKTIKQEYKQFNRAINLVGKPWESNKLKNLGGGYLRNEANLMGKSLESDNLRDLGSGYLRNEDNLVGKPLESDNLRNLGGGYLRKEDNLVGKPLESDKLGDLGSGYLRNVDNLVAKPLESDKLMDMGSGYLRNEDNVVGKPWESDKLEDLGSGYLRKEGNFDGKLDYRKLKELALIFEERKVDSLDCFLDDDVELEEGMLDDDDGGRSVSFLPRQVSEVQAIKILVERLSVREITMKDWKFTRMMKQSRLQFTEVQLLKIVGGLGERGCWRQAMEVVGWVYSRKEHMLYKSRFVYTKLLAVLGKARKPHDALRIFKQMRGDCHIYPDMAAYHSIAVTLGQSGMVRELMRIIECMKEKPSKYVKNVKSKSWDPTLQPDIVVFNSVLNACVPSHQWKGVSWVFEQIRKSGLKANSATYGLAMEVMLHSSKYELVHELFQKMAKSGMSPNSNTYKVLVRTFWKEGKVDDAVNIVRDMEQRGIKGSPSVYYELACCLCNKGRWQDAMTEIKKLKKLRLSKPLAVTFTGMIMSSMDGGYIADCISIFEHMLEHCPPNIGTVNAVLKVYGRNDMFTEVKDLFEKVKAGYTAFLGDDGTPLLPDVYTYQAVLEASAYAHQWEYFEYVYKEMCFSGYQLDQGKYATLLVEASKAGKWHLLEHAFETTLEAGQIPNPLLFTEMICEAMLQADYGKAANIISSMAHAPFQLNKQDWMDLFEKNKDRISDEHLEVLSTTLCESNMPNESTVSELLKALHSVCGSMQNKSEGHQELVINDFYQDKKSSGQSSDGKRGMNETGAICSNYDSDEDDRASLSSKMSSFVDVAFDESGCLSEDFLHVNMHRQDDFDDMLPSDAWDYEVGELDEPGLPSADEILRSWKKSQSKDQTSSLAY